jgi:hypothetical protein
MGLAVACAIAVAGCGGGTGGESPTTTTGGDAGASTMEDQGAIRATVERIAEKAEPAICTEAMTEKWVDDSYPPAGAGALADCRDAQKPGTKILAKGVRFGSIEVDGNEAVAVFEERGPDVGGAEGRIRLLQDGAGVWRVDELLDVRIVDRDRYFQAARAGLVRDPAGLDDDRADCMIGELQRLPNAALERLSVTNHSPVRVFATCLGDGSVRRAALALVRLALADSQRYRENAGCAVARLDRLLNASQARAYLGQEDREVFQALVAHALAACGAVPPLRGDERSLT